MSACYVYAYRVDGTLWYIGKGTGNTCRRHINRAKRKARRACAWQRELSTAIDAGADVQIDILHSGLTDAEAFALEIELIAALNPVKNKLAGGNGSWRKMSAT